MQKICYNKKCDFFFIFGGEFYHEYRPVRASGIFQLHRRRLQHDVIINFAVCTERRFNFYDSFLSDTG